MIDFWLFVLMAVAGGFGAISRFVLDGWVAAHVHRAIPVGTIIINILGSLLLGLLAGLALHQPGLAELKFILGTGLAGGFTTFSTASVEGANLATATGRLTWRGISNTVIHALSMLILSLGAAWAGMLIAG